MSPQVTDCHKNVAECRTDVAQVSHTCHRMSPRVTACRGACRGVSRTCRGVSPRRGMSRVSQRVALVSPDVAACRGRVAACRGRVAACRGGVARCRGRVTGVSRSCHPVSRDVKRGQHRVTSCLRVDIVIKTHHSGGWHAAATPYSPCTVLTVTVLYVGPRADKLPLSRE